MPAIGFCLESEANFVKKSEKTCDERSFERVVLWPYEVDYSGDDEWEELGM